MSPDRYTRRTGDDFADGLAMLLPTGAAWPRDAASDLMRFVSGLGQIWGDVAARADTLLTKETDPRQTVEMLSDWERAFGLPDDCLGPAPTTDARRTRLMQRVTMEGGQSRDFFTALATSLGYAISIVEFSPFMCGVGRCGDDQWQVASPDIRFYWVVQVFGVPVWWFRAGVGESGKDHLAEWAAVIDLECLIRRYKPAQTQVIFAYQS